MASAGERFAMPDGSVYIMRRPAAETGGAFVEMEFVLPSGCVPPPPHVHPHQVEEYEVGPAADPVEPFLAGARDAHGQPGALELIGDGLGDVRIVLDDEHTVQGSTSRSSW